MVYINSPRLFNKWINYVTVLICNTRGWANGTNRTI